ALDFLGQLALRALAIAVAYNQHPHHQLRIDRWPADLAVIRPQLRAHTTQHRRHKNVDSSEQVLFRNAIFEPKLIEQTRLIASLPPHHRRLQEADPRNQRNHCSSMFSSLFRQHRSFASIRWSLPHVPFTPDSFAKVTAETLWNRNRQQSNRSERVLESMLRIHP